MEQAVWKVTYRVTARWSKRQNLATAVGGRVTLCVVSFVPVSRFLYCDLIAMPALGAIANLSRVIAPNLRAAPVVLEGQVAAAGAAVLARNAIAAARWVTLRVRAPRRPEVAQEVTAVAAEAEEEATVVLGAAVKKHGAFSHDSCLVGINTLFSFFFEVTLAVE